MSATKRKMEESNGRRRKGRGNTLPADWSGVDAEAIRTAIVAVTTGGGAIRFGYTRDGGSYAVGILGDGEPYTEYLRPTDDVAEYLTDLADDWKAPAKLLGEA